MQMGIIPICTKDAIFLAMFDWEDSKNVEHHGIQDEWAKIKFFLKGLG